MNCKSSNIVYLVTCDRCALQYVGETSLPLHERMYKYRNKIDSDQVDPNLTAVEEHFRTFNNHDGTADFTIQPISFTYNLREFPEDNKCRLLDLEDFWIKILKTKEPQGLNQATLSTDRVIPLILPYTKTIHEWGKAQIQHWLNSVGPLYKTTIPNRVLCALTKPNNLRDLLCSAALGNPYQLDKEKIADNDSENLDSNQYQPLNWTGRRIHQQLIFVNWPDQFMLYILSSYLYIFPCVDIYVTLQLYESLYNTVLLEVYSAGNILKVLPVYLRLTYTYLCFRMYWLKSMVQKLYNRKPPKTLKLNPNSNP